MNANDQFETLTDQIEEGISKGKFTWKELKSAVVDKTKEAVQTTDTYVRDNPWKVIGIAAGVGLILGLILMRSGKDDSED